MFKPEDFYRGVNHTLTIGIGNDGKYISLSNVLSITNAIVESWPVVFSGDSYNNKWIDCKTMHTTKKARLAFIEESPKEPCKHEPQLRFDGTHCKTPPIYYEPTGIWCKHCGVELHATWSEKK